MTSTIFRSILCAFVLALTITVCAHPAVAKTPLPCSKPKCMPHAPIMKGLKHVALNIWLPAPYKRAIECHGREKECVDKIDASRPDQELKYLLDHYQALPAPLHPDNLTRLFTARIEQEVMPHVEPDESCRIPQVVVIEDNKNQFLFEDDPDALMIVVSLYMFTSTKPGTAVLTIHQYRKHFAMKNTFIPLTAIPLDSPHPEISKLLEAFVTRLEVTTTCEISQSPPSRR